MKTIQLYLELTKPKLTLLVLATSFLGFWMASGESMDWQRLALTLGSCALLGGGINALNQCLETDFDALMERTKQRPLPSGRLNLSSAFHFGVIAASAGVILLAGFVSPLCAMLGLATAISYALFYTPLKRLSPLNTLAGAIPGALPTLIGWGAAEGRISLGGWLIFALLFAWQLPHFFSIAWIYRQDYENSGFKMVTLRDTDGSKTAIFILLGTLALILVSFLPIYYGFAGNLYGFFVIVGDAAILFHAVQLCLEKLRGAKMFTRLSIYYMILIIVGMAADKLW